MSPDKDDGNPIRVALMAMLKKDAGLKLISNGVFYRKAPQPKSTPYVIVSKITGTPEHTFDGPPMDDEIFLVKGVGSPNQAEAIDRACRKLLNRNTELVVNGKEFFSVFPILDVDYEDNTDGEEFQHVGAEYRIKSEEEA